MQIEEYIVNILRNEMGIPQSNIWIQSQNRKIPPESEELYCIVGVRFFDPISVKSRWIPETAQEEQVFYGRADVQIDLLSRSNEARIRRSEILMALNSFYSKNFQDEKCFRIFKIPTSFINTSDLQGGSDINRFTLIIPTMISEKKIVGFDYYDKFRMSVQDEKSIIANINEQNYTFTIKPVPEDATVTINGVEQKSIYTYGDVNWKVEKPDYKSEEGNLFLTKDTVYNVTLQQMATLTVLPDPEDAIVKINNIEQTSITVPVGTVVKVEVSKSGYETKIENIVVDEDKSVNITLEKISIKVTVSVATDPIDAIVTMNGTVGNIQTFDYGTEVVVTASKEGYLDSSINLGVVTHDISTNITLTLDSFTYTIVPTPSDAIVTINDEQRTSITGSSSTEIRWKVEKDGYITQEGTDKIGTEDRSINIVLENVKVTFTIIPTPSDAEVKLNNIVQSSIEVNYGDTVAWEVSKDGYTPQSGITSPLLTNTELPITLAEIIPVFTFTINPTPSEAIVTINEEQTRSVTVEEGTKIIWSVTMDNYTPQNGELVVTQDTTLDITLEEIPEYKYVWMGDAAADGVTFKAYSGAGVDVTNETNTSVSYGETNLSVLNDLYSDSPTENLQLVNAFNYTAKFYVNFQDKITLKTIQMKVKAPTNATDKRLWIYNADTDERIGSIQGTTSKALHTIMWDAAANKELSGFYVQRNDTSYIIEIYSLYIEAE
jgi:hypothetical protein|nr:MAG TPA: hypothetical protein [Caudoviricetes sp.]